MGFCENGEQLESTGLNDGDSFIEDKRIPLDKFIKDNQESFHFKLDEKFESNGDLKLINVCEYDERGNIVRKATNDSEEIYEYDGFNNLVEYT